MIVSKTPNIKIPVSILAVEATAGFIISTNGLTRNSDISERDIAIPLKKPATPIPNVNHIFSHRDDTKSINANTGKDDTKQYPVYLTSVSNSKVPLGKKMYMLPFKTSSIFKNKFYILFVKVVATIMPNILRTITIP